MKQYSKGDTLEFAEWVERTRVGIVLEGPITGRQLIERYNYNSVPMILYNYEHALEVFSMKHSLKIQSHMTNQVYYSILIGDHKGWLSERSIDNLSMRAKKKEPFGLQ